jgi:putative transposase
MSGDRYFLREKNGVYYLTLTVVYWIDIFTRKDYKHIIIDSIKYCQANKGLILYGWVLMSNHLHLIVKADEGFNISDILRDFKKHTSKQIIRTVKETNESRQEWMLHKFEYAGKQLKRISNYKLWRDDNHAILLENEKIMQQKLEYLHNNPVVAEIVEEAHEYIYSSAKFYSELPCLIKCERI